MRQKREEQEVGEVVEVGLADIGLDTNRVSFETIFQGYPRFSIQADGGSLPIYDARTEVVEAAKKWEAAKKKSVAAKRSRQRDLSAQRSDVSQAKAVLMKAFLGSPARIGVQDLLRGDTGEYTPQVLILNDLEDGEEAFGTLVAFETFGTRYIRDFGSRIRTVLLRDDDRRHRQSDVRRHLHVLFVEFGQELTCMVRRNASMYQEIRISRNNPGFCSTRTFRVEEKGAATKAAQRTSKKEADPRLSEDIIVLKPMVSGLGPAKIKKLAKAGIKTVGDCLAENVDSKVEPIIGTVGGKVWKDLLAAAKKYAASQ